MFNKMFLKIVSRETTVSNGGQVIFGYVTYNNKLTLTAVSFIVGEMFRFPKGMV